MLTCLLVPAPHQESNQVRLVFKLTVEGKAPFVLVVSDVDQELFEGYSL
jgi:hypothetical protein